MNKLLIIFIFFTGIFYSLFSLVGEKYYSTENSVLKAPEIFSMYDVEITPKPVSGETEIESGYNAAKNSFNTIATGLICPPVELINTRFYLSEIDKFSNYSCAICGKKEFYHGISPPAQKYFLYQSCFSPVKNR